MESYKSEFIDFMVESDVLKFGDFTLKSGRKSDRKSTRLNSSHIEESRMPSSA